MLERPINYLYSFLGFKEENKESEKKAELAPEQENSEINAEKERLVQRVNEMDPECFIDEMNFKNVLKEPMITMEGHIYEKNFLVEWIQNHHHSPKTRQPCTLKDVCPLDGVQKIIADFQEQKDILLKKIANVSTVEQLEMVNKHIERYRIYLDTAEQAFTLKCTTTHIHFLKQRLYLDIQNPLHIKFWSEQKKCFNQNSMRVFCEGEWYRISPRVYEVMLAAKENYSSVKDFYKAIDIIRKKPEGFKERFFGRTANYKMIREENFLAQNFLPHTPTLS